MQRPSHVTPEIRRWSQRVLRTRAAGLLMRKTPDSALLFPLQRWFFPLSRLWAAANEAQGDPQAFRLAIDGTHRTTGRLAAGFSAGVLRSHERARLRMVRARTAWEHEAFEGDAVDPQAFARLEGRRRQAAALHMATRSLFYPLLFSARPPAARWSIATSLEASAVWGKALDDPAACFAATSMPGEVRVSPQITRGGTREYWLRFPSPCPRMALRPETAFCYARVIEPTDADGIPTLIAGSGLCLESDLMWPAMLDTSSVAGLMGFRIVDMVSPYHGLRAWNDRYGGEPFFASAPVGTLDLIVGQTLETAALTGWCRARFGGSIAVGGISMSSFVAQQVASRCNMWPAEQRPDAIFLIGHTGDMAEVTFQSDLVRSIGLDRELSRAGWTEDALRTWSPLLDPAASPALPPDRIVSALGTTDRVLPYAGGAALAQRWKLPPENTFHFPVGHIIMPLGLLRDDQPLRRLKEILTAG